MSDRTARPRLVDFIALDLDDTLLGDDRGRDAAAGRLATCGVPWMAATGRVFESAVAAIGSAVPPPVAIASDVGTELWWREGDSWVYDSAWTASLGPEALLVAGRVARTLGLSRQGRQTRFKQSFFATAEEARRARELTADDDVHVVHSHGRFLDILAGDAGKGRAVSWVARRLDVPMDRVGAVGDSGNDRCMLRAAGRPAVVSNVLAELRSEAQESRWHVCCRPRGFGVAEAIDRLAPQRRQCQNVSTGARDRASRAAGIRKPSASS